MGDEAEQRFEEWCKRNKRGYVTYGLRRPPVQVYKLPARVRYTPDYLTTKSFVEVQGLGTDQQVKMKLEKWGSLHYWNDLHPVDLYLWDSKKERECLIPLLTFDTLLGSASLDQFDQSKPYFKLGADEVFALAGEG